MHTVSIAWQHFWWLNKSLHENIHKQFFRFGKSVLALNNTQVRKGETCVHAKSVFPASFNEFKGGNRSFFCAAKGES